MKTLSGRMDSFSIKIDKPKGVEISFLIDGEFHGFNLPGISDRSRVSVFEKLHDKVGQEITVISDPPNSIVITLGSVTLQFGAKH